MVEFESFESVVRWFNLTLGISDVTPLGRADFMDFRVWFMGLLPGVHDAMFFKVLVDRFLHSSEDLPHTVRSDSGSVVQLRSLDLSHCQLTHFIHPIHFVVVYIVKDLEPMAAN